MARLDIERQLSEEPKRIAFAISEIEKRGYVVAKTGAHELQFEYKGQTVRFWPYTGWHSGKTVKAGRGIEKLLKQIKF